MIYNYIKLFLYLWIIKKCPFLWKVLSTIEGASNRYSLVTCKKLGFWFCFCSHFTANTANILVVVGSTHSSECSPAHCPTLLTDEHTAPCHQQPFPAQLLLGLNFSRPLLFFTEEWLCNIRLSHTRLSSNHTAETLPCNRYQATRPALVHQHTEASILL